VLPVSPPPRPERERRTVVFDDAVESDDLDVPDFLK
jgi:hypothetical protein